LPLALSQLADLCTATGNYSRAEECLQELIDRNKDDERLVERLNQLRAQSGGTSQPTVEEKAEKAASEPPPRIDENEKPIVPPPPAIIEETFDEETQKYIAQALTDVDLFSSYGLTQKATHLLENVLQRAPRHTPTLERLLDLHLGAGNERRTAELASQLEQIHRERNDTVNADRFLELRQRFQKAAGMSEDELPAAPPIGAAPAAPPAPQAQASVESAVPASEPPAFGVTPSPTKAEAAASTSSVFEELKFRYSTGIATGVAEPAACRTTSSRCSRNAYAAAGTCCRATPCRTDGRLLTSPAEEVDLLGRVGSDDSGRRRHGDECPSRALRRKLPSLRLSSSSRRSRASSTSSPHHPRACAHSRSCRNSGATLRRLTRTNRLAPGHLSRSDLRDIVSAELGEESAPEPTFQPVEDAAAEAEPVDLAQAASRSQRGARR
jgi:hypothetical protein